MKSSSFSFLYIWWLSKEPFGSKLRRSLCLLGGASLLGEKDGLDVGEYTTLGDGDTAEEFVQLFVVTDSQLQVTWDDSCLLVVTGCVACQLEDLSC